MTVALVDASGSEEWLELVRSALAAALEALPGTALFGLVTFGTQVRAYFPDMRNLTLPYPHFHCPMLTRLMFKTLPVTAPFGLVSLGT